MTIGSILQASIRVLVVAILLSGCASQANPGAQAIRETLQRAATAAEAEGDYAAAVNHYGNLADRRPDDIDATLGLARNLRYSGRAKLAVEVLDKAAAKFGDQVLFVVERGKANLAVGNVTEAIGFFANARAKDEQNWETHAALGIAYDLTESFAKARESYGRALQLSKDNPVVLNNMAISAALSGDVERAIATLENAPLAARHGPQIRQNLALFYGIKGDMEKAEALAKMDLDEASVRNNLAVFSRFRASQSRPPTPVTRSQ
ncbi:MAG: tetratricopeptide repeat protein [Rhodospirillales bacterium]|nr:tetratricopeptide repeat protein [Rhodospirillales bacterium]